MDTTYRWPDFVQHAFRTYYYGGQYEKPLEAFEQRWGGFDAQTLLHALIVGSSEEKVLALLTIGYSDMPQKREMLLPYLQSAEPMERWASALCLGEMQEEKALSVLVHMLDEFLPPQSHPLERDGGLYHFWRSKAVALLGESGRSDLAPVLRQMLIKVWTIEQAEQGKRKQVWHGYQDELVYALGRLGTFGALTGLDIPKARIRLWMITLVCGTLQARVRYGDILTQIQIQQELKDEVALVLQQRFGLSAKEQLAYIDSYSDEYFARME